MQFETKIVNGKPSIFFKEGEFFIHNNHALHGRSAFQPNFDGNDRFLTRCFATFDYEKSNYAREGHMVKAMYS